MAPPGRGPFFYDDDRRGNNMGRGPMGARGGYGGPHGGRGGPFRGGGGRGGGMGACSSATRMTTAPQTIYQCIGYIFRQLEPRNAALQQLGALSALATRRPEHRPPPAAARHCVRLPQAHHRHRCRQQCQ